MDHLSVDELRFDRLLDAPIDTVWRYIADPELRALWFMAGPSDLRPGGTLGLSMRHDNLSDQDVPTPEKYAGYIGRSWTEEVLRIEPPHLLAFTWDGGRSGEVTITLEAEGDQTRLQLVHTGIPAREDAINFAGGWGAHLAVLQRRLRGDAVPSFWAIHAEAEASARSVLASDA